MNNNNRIVDSIKSFLRPTYHCLQALSKGVPMHSETYWERKFDPNRHKSTFKIDLSRQQKLVREYQYLCTVHKRIPINETSSDWYFNSPIRPKTVMILGLGKNVRGNMQYVLEELNSSPEFEGYQIYVRASLRTYNAVRDFIAKNNWKRTHIVVTDRDYNMLLASVKYLITEVYFPETWAKKPGQVSVNIWHGTPLKKLGLSKNSESTHKNGITQKNFIDADYLLYPNEYTKEKMLDSYRVSQLMNGKTIMLGYPRTGGMLAAAQEDLSQVRRKLAPNGEKIFAYMPTFRDYLDMSESIAQAKELLEYLDQNMADDQILYVNLHHKLNDSINYNTYKKIHKFPSDLDSYRLLAASDGLISDYSSVFFDYLALRRQIILYIPDLKRYRKKRGMYMNLLDLPFDMARTPEAVIEAMNRGKEYDDTEVFHTFSRYDSPENAAKLCKLLTPDPDLSGLTEIPHDSRKRTLIFSEALQPGEETELLHRFTASYDREAQDVYLCCNANRVDENKEAAFPMLFETPVIGSELTSRVTALGKTIRTMYKDKKISFAQAMGLLQYDYALMTRRIYGNAKFDTVVIYDTPEPERYLEFSVIPNPKVLFLQKEVLEQMKEGARFLTDAVRFAAKYSRSVCVRTQEQKDLAESLLPPYWKDKVQVVDTPEKMSRVIFSEE